MELYGIGSGMVGAGIVIAGAMVIVGYPVVRRLRKAGEERREAGTGRMPSGLKPQWFPEEPRASHSASVPCSEDPACVQGLMQRTEECEPPLHELVEAIRVRPVERIGSLELRSLTTSLFFAIARANDPTDGEPVADDVLASASQLYGELVREEQRRSGKAIDH